MSDGNFNTKLIPPGGFASGVRVGEARMKQRALTALRQVLSEHSAVDDHLRITIEAKVKSLLD